MVDLCPSDAVVIRSDDPIMAEAGSDVRSGEYLLVGRLFGSDRVVAFHPADGEKPNAVALESAKQGELFRVRQVRGHPGDRPCEFA